jgi:hypothetical protein
VSPAGRETSHWGLTMLAMLKLRKVRSYSQIAICDVRFTSHNLPATSNCESAPGSFPFGSFEEHFARGLNSIDRRWKARI